MTVRPRAAASELATPPPGAHPPVHSAPGSPRAWRPHVPDHPTCFACGPRVPNGPGLTITERRPDGVSATAVLDEVYQGAPGIAHGGLVATLLDEAASLAVWQSLGRPTVTGRLELQYHAPVPVGVPLAVTARCTATAGRRVFAEAAIAPVGEPKVCAEAAAVFIEVPHSHFTAHAP
ncbi:PaaI family thioesterase [Streptomyces odontomachi]|uniref:PaaI family thioesterase n=1 Tax=Streptomyces odontomachi TaxID=2944940 RepID=UPI00210A15C4|nr:PaaI family thioesterase [Streptomyces sp. ODS25]